MALFNKNGGSAQAGLEYLMTYGRVLVLVASILGVLVFVVSSPASQVTFSSSDPTKFLLKGASVSGNTAGLVLQNATGGHIKVVALSFFGDLTPSADFRLNESSSFPVDVVAGGEMRFDGISSAPGCAAGGTVMIFYLDAFGFERQAKTSCNSGSMVPAGAVAWYKFDEGSGETANDSSGNGNNGSLLPSGSGPSWQSGCPNGSCLSFDGVNDYVNAGNGASLSITDEITVSGWVYNTRNYGGTSYDQIFGKGMDGAYAAFWSQSNGSITFRLYLGGVSRGINASQKIGVNAWKHLAFTYNGSTMKIYVNGSSDSSSNYSGSIGTNALYFGIGKDPSRSYYFNGLIDEVQIFNRALSAGEICSECKRHANAAVGAVCNC